MLSSRLIREQIGAGEIAFGINHEMRDFRQNRRKNLDLVLCTPDASTTKRPKRTFLKLAEIYDIQLSESASHDLGMLPTLMEAPVGSVRIALEAKACMTSHIKAIPRLFDELNSSHFTVHGASDRALAAAFVMVNTASEFASPGRFGYCPKCGHRVAPMNQHRQPDDADAVISKLTKLPRKVKPQEDGFEAIGILAVNCRNDGSPVVVDRSPPAPPQGDIFHYDQMISRLAHVYEGRFGYS